MTNLRIIFPLKENIMALLTIDTSTKDNIDMGQKVLQCLEERMRKMKARLEKKFKS